MSAEPSCSAGTHNTCLQSCHSCLWVKMSQRTNSQVLHLHIYAKKLCFTYNTQYYSMHAYTHCVLMLILSNGAVRTSSSILTINNFRLLFKLPFYFSSIISICTSTDKLIFLFLISQLAWQYWKSTSQFIEGRFTLFFAHCYQPFSPCLSQESNKLHTVPFTLKIRLSIKLQHQAMNEDLGHLNHMHLFPITTNSSLPSISCRRLAWR